MSIQSEITRLKAAKANLKTSLENKGATVPSNTKLDGYPTIVNGLPNAAKYGATIDAYLGSIDENGIMQEPVGEPLELVFTGVKIINNSRSINIPNGHIARGNVALNWQTVKSASFPDLEEVREDGLKNAFYKTSIESVSFPKLKYIAPTPGSSYNNYAFNSTFENKPVWDNGAYKGGLKTVSFPELEEIKSGCGQIFTGCFTGNVELTSVSFPKLKKISSQMQRAGFSTGPQAVPITTTEMPALEEYNANATFLFYAQSSITTVNFPSLKKLAGVYGFGSTSQYTSGFYGCTSLTSATFPSLDDVTNCQNAFYYAFSGCTSLTSVSFGGLKSTSFGNTTTHFNNMLCGLTGCTVHFPSNLQSVIGSWTSVTNGFGGTNTTVSFDLPATE